MLLELLDAATLTRVVQHGNAEAPFVDSFPARYCRVGRDVLVLLVQSGDDERLSHQPTAEVDATNLVRAIIPPANSAARPGGLQTNSLQRWM